MARLYAKEKMRVAIQPLAPRKDFPRLVSTPDLAYLDSAAATMPAASVIRAMQEFQEQRWGAAGRGIYAAAYGASEAYGEARKVVAALIGAGSSEIVFTANATAALNIAAHMESQRLRSDDEIILTVAEHHSNILPWQRAVAATGARLVWLSLDETGTFPLQEFTDRLSTRTKVVALAHVSNVLGYVAPLSEVVALAHRVGARVVVDATQSSGRISLDVGQLDLDYAAFSGHKMYGPTGSGWLYAKAAYLEEAEPFLVGGGMVMQVGREEATWLSGPQRHEAGTPDVTAAVGAAAAAAYLASIGLARILDHERALTEYALAQLNQIPGLCIFGPAPGQARAGIIAFELKSAGARIHSHDLAGVADEDGVAIRSGHHCAQILLQSLGFTDIARLSLGMYTSSQEIDRLVLAIEKAQSLFAPRWV